MLKIENYRIEYQQNVINSGLLFQKARIAVFLQQTTFQGA